MIAFVEIIRAKLPICVSIDLKFVVESVVIEVVPRIPFLCVDAVEFLFPGLRCLRGIEVDPDKSQCIDMKMYFEKTVLASVKVLDVVVPWRLRQFAIECVRPAVVSTG